MKIIVCVKQVPASQNVSVDEKTGILRRDGVKSKLNPYDLFAIELALTIKGLKGGDVRLLTMGPKQAELALHEGISMGADSAVLLSDARFAGSDTLATSRALSGAIRYLGGADIILAGKQTTDGDTAQVGPEVAEFLNIPHAAGIVAVADIGGDGVRVKQTLGGDIIELKIKMPCMLCTDKEINTPRLPSFLRGRGITAEMVTHITLDDLPDKRWENYGIAGSPTQVVSIFAPQNTIKRKIYEAGSVELADMLSTLLTAQKYIE